MDIKEETTSKIEKKGRFNSASWTKAWKKVKQLFNSSNGIDGEYIGKEVIIRTYSAGVWFGEILQKKGAEIILANARRMWYWKAKKSISLSAVAKYGICDSSKICPAVEKVWLQPIEIIECTKSTINEIKNAPEVKQR